MKLFKVIVSSALVFSLIAPSMVSAQKIESAATKEKPVVSKTVEYFELEVLSDEMVEIELANGVTEMQYIPIGYEKVQAITEISQTSDNISTKVTSLSDFYDLNGNFVESEFEVDNFDNNLLKANATHTLSMKKFDTPQVSEIAKLSSKKAASEINVIHDLTLSKENQIESKLVNLNKTITFDLQKTTEEKGISKEDIEILKELSKNMHEYNVVNLNSGTSSLNEEAFKQMIINEYPNLSTLATSAADRMAGAFDNYYNYWGTSTNFAVQSLSGAANQYVKVTGKTLGSTLNNSTFTNFANNIDKYDAILESQLNYPMWTEILGWAGALASLGLLVVTYPVGPVGWVAIATYYSGALITLAGLTTTAYATSSRLKSSKNAAQYLENARALNNYKNFENYSMTLVSGF